MGEGSGEGEGLFFFFFFFFSCLVCWSCGLGGWVHFLSLGGGDCFFTTCFRITVGQSGGPFEQQRLVLYRKAQPISKGLRDFHDEQNVKAEQ